MSIQGTKSGLKQEGDLPSWAAAPSKKKKPEEKNGLKSFDELFGVMAGLASMHGFVWYNWFESTFFKVSVILLLSNYV